MKGGREEGREERRKEGRKENTLRTYMQKFSLKYLQTKFNNTLKRSYILIKFLSFRVDKWLIQHTQINKYNPALNRIKKKIT
jgi:predicted transposase YdaD